MGLRTMLGLKKTRPPSPLPLPPECARWFEDKDFTADLLHKKLGPWLPALKHLINSPCNVLDVGTFEGRSAVAFLEYLPQSSVTTVDLFEDPEIERRCERNLAPYGDRVSKRKGRAAAILARLASEGKTFDVIYLDAGKRRSDTFAHSCLAWPLLLVGGVIIWDDLMWKPQESPSERPGGAIDLFAQVFRGCLVELHRHHQLIARKIAEWPTN